jgi:hypothetical protein
MFGWDLAKRAQVFAPRVRWSVARAWDKAMFRTKKLSLEASLGA